MEKKPNLVNNHIVESFLSFESSFGLKHSRRRAIAITAQRAQGVSTTDGAIRSTEIAEAILAPGNRLARARIADTHIAQTVFAVGSTFAAANIAEGVFAPSGAALRVPDVAETVLAQGTTLAIVTLVAGIAEAVLAIGAVGCMYRTWAEGYQYHGQ